MMKSVMYSQYSFDGLSSLSARTAPEFSLCSGVVCSVSVLPSQLVHRRYLDSWDYWQCNGADSCDECGENYCRD